MKTLTCEVAGDISFPESPSVAKMVEKLRVDLSLPNPVWEKAQAMGFKVKEDTPETFEGLTEEEDELGDTLVRIPRGAVQTLKARAKECGVELTFIDKRSRGTPINVAFGRKPRPEYQPDAINAALKHIQGVLVMPCGAGKTTTGFAIIAKVGVSALVIVHTGDLADQWMEGCREVLGFEPGMISEGKVDVRGITIATVQTLNLLPAHERRRILSSFGLVLVDEAHHAPASTWQTVLMDIPARWRIGLTATPDREDGLEPLMYRSLGPKLFEVTQKQLIEWGYLHPAEIRVIYTTFEFEGKADKARKARAIQRSECLKKGIPPPELTPDDLRRLAHLAAGDYREAITKLVQSEERNGAIADLVVQEARAGETVLVLSGEKEHCKILAKMISDRGVRCEVLTSATAKKKRKAFLDEMRAGTLQVATATQLADEGLDVPRLSRVHIAFPGKAQGRLIQRIGRIMRKHDSKVRAVLTDYADKHCTQFWKQFKERRKVYESMGKVKFIS